MASQAFLVSWSRTQTAQQQVGVALAGLAERGVHTVVCSPRPDRTLFAPADHVVNISKGFAPLEEFIKGARWTTKDTVVVYETGRAQHPKSDADDAWDAGDSGRYLKWRHLVKTIPTRLRLVVADHDDALGSAGHFEDAHKTLSVVPAAYREGDGHSAFAECFWRPAILDAIGSGADALLADALRETFNEWRGIVPVVTMSAGWCPPGWPSLGTDVVTIRTTDDWAAQQAVRRAPGQLLVLGYDRPARASNGPHRFRYCFTRLARHSGGQHRFALTDQADVVAAYGIVPRVPFTPTLLVFDVWGHWHELTADEERWRNNNLGACARTISHIPRAFAKAVTEAHTRLVSGRPEVIEFRWGTGPWTAQLFSLFASDPDPTLRARVAHEAGALMLAPSAAASWGLALLRQLLRDRSAAVRTAAIEACRQLAVANRFPISEIGAFGPLFRRALGSRHPAMVVGAARVLIALSKTEALETDIIGAVAPALRRLFVHPQDAARAGALEAYGMLAVEDFEDAELTALTSLLDPLLTGRSSEVRGLAAELYVRLTKMRHIAMEDVVATMERLHALWELMPPKCREWVAKCIERLSECMDRTHAVTILRGMLGAPGWRTTTWAYYVHLVKTLDAAAIDREGAALRAMVIDPGRRATAVHAYELLIGHFSAEELAQGRPWLLAYLESPALRDEEVQRAARIYRAVVARLRV